MEELPDQALADRVRRGETQLYRQLVDRYAASLHRYAAHMLGSADDADDVVQETLIKAYRNLWSYDTRRPFNSWLYRIAHNEGLNWLRARKRLIYGESAATILEQSGARESPEADFAAQELRDVLERWLDDVPLVYREPISLHYLDEYSYQEISDILRIPVKTVGSRISRGKVILRTIINREGRSHV